MRVLGVLSPHTRMIAALYPACCTLSSEIEVKDNGIGNWLINPVEARACWRAAATFQQLLQGNTNPELPFPVQGGDLAGWLGDWMTG